MAVQVLSLARYDIHPSATEELNALIEKKQWRMLPGVQQVHLSLDSLLLEDKCVFYIRDVQRRRRNNEVWLSEPFYCGPESYKMCLGVYPNGENGVRGRYESVFLQLLEGEFDDTLHWPLKGTATVKLLDRSTSWFPRDLVETFPFTFHHPVRLNQRWSGGAMQNRVSMPEFAQLVCGYDSPYEVDDCSCFEVCIKVEHCMTLYS